MERFKEPKDGSPSESMLVLEERAELCGTAHPMGMQGSRRDDGMNVKRKERTSNNEDAVEVMPMTTKMGTKKNRSGG
jgi:hypothetical protein